MIMSHSKYILIYIATLVILLPGCTGIGRSLPNLSPPPAQPIAGGYELPLSYSLREECSGKGQIKYEVKPDGTFTFRDSLSSNTPIGKEPTINTDASSNFVQLNSADMTELLSLLNQLDLVRLAGEDKAIPPNSPQTTECRILESVNLNLNGKTGSFARNGRDKIHSPAYLNAIKILHDHLEKLQTIYSSLSTPIAPVNPNKFSHQYSLPLKVTMSNECAGSTFTLYEISPLGKFTFALSNNPALNTSQPPTLTRNLIQEDIQAISDMLTKIDLAEHAKSDKKNPPSTPQTAECRSIENFTFNVDTVSKTYDRNNRTIKHSNFYLQGLNKLSHLLDKIKEKYEKGQPADTRKEQSIYRPEIVWKVKDECGTSSSTKYEINSRAEFTYNQNPLDPNAKKMRKLQRHELQNFQSVLRNIDIFNLSRQDKPIPEDAPQTSDCRMIETIELKLTGSKRIFDKNGRRKTHSEAYLEGFKSLEQHLQKLIDFKPIEKNQYQLPLTVEAKGECNLGDKFLYQIDNEGLFTFTPNSQQFIDAQAPVIQSHKLADSDLSDFKQLLKDIDLAKLAIADKKTPDDAPQTKECRSVHLFRIGVNGSEKTFDHNSRELTHSQAYLKAIESLTLRLENLKNKYQATSKKYALPIELNLKGECEMGEKVIYKVFADGKFEYTQQETLLNDALTVDPILNRQLTESQQNELELLLQEVNISKLAEDSTSLAPDAPQTAECRVIENYILSVDGQRTIYDRNGRSKNHTEAYQKALDRIRAKLKSFKESS